MSGHSNGGANEDADTAVRRKRLGIGRFTHAHAGHERASDLRALTWEHCGIARDRKAGLESGAIRDARRRTAWSPHRPPPSLAAIELRNMHQVAALDRGARLCAA